MTSWARPAISALELTPQDGQIGISVQHSMPAHSAGRLQYSLGNGWLDMSLTGTALVSGLMNGQSYTVQVRAVLDGMESEYLTGQAMPRSAGPRPPTIARVLLDGHGLDRLVVQLDELTPVATGGWDPGDYQFCGSSGSTCLGGYTNSRDVTVPASGGIVLWTVAGAGGGMIPVPAATSQPPRLSGSNTVSFSFSQVESGSCTIYNSLGSGEEEHVNGPFEPVNGVMSYSGEQWIAQEPIMVTPPPTEEDPEPTPQPQPDAEPRRIRVVCQINGITSTYNLK